MTTPAATRMSDCKIRDLDEALEVLEEIRSQTYSWERRWSNAAKFVIAHIRAARAATTKEADNG